MSTDNKIAEALGLTPLDQAINVSSNTGGSITIIDPTDISVPTLPSVNSQDELIDDIEKARTNIDTLMEKGAESLDELLVLAKQSQNPRAFEVVSTLMKTLIDANKEYVGMSEKKKYAKDDHPAQQSTTNVTNNNLILSTADMLKMLKGDT